MAGCADAAYQVVAAVALQTLGREPPHVGAVAKGVEQICKDCQAECEKFPKVAECKACGDWKACAAECAKAAADIVAGFDPAAVFGASSDILD